MTMLVRDWIVKQLVMGEFHSNRAVWWASVVMALKIAFFAILIDGIANVTLTEFHITRFDLGALLAFGVFMTPLIAFPVAFVAYAVVGFAIKDLAISRAEFEKLSRTDVLSGLPNRRAFLEAFDHCNKDKLILVLDIDRFKQINDMYGHHVGDQVIMRVAQMMEREFGEGFMVARIGGEEFAVFTHCVSMSEFFAKSDYVRERIGVMQIATDSNIISVAVSGGIASAGPEEQFSELFSRADRALYGAKAAGRNQILVAEESKPIVSHELAVAAA